MPACRRLAVDKWFIAQPSAISLTTYSRIFLTLKHVAFFHLNCQKMKRYLLFIFFFSFMQAIAAQPNKKQVENILRDQREWQQRQIPVNSYFYKANLVQSLPQGTERPLLRGVQVPLRSERAQPAAIQYPKPNLSQFIQRQRESVRNYRHQRM